MAILRAGRSYTRPITRDGFTTQEPRVTLPMVTLGYRIRRISTPEWVVDALVVILTDSFLGSR